MIGTLIGISFIISGVSLVDALAGGVAANSESGLGCALKGRTFGCAVRELYSDRMIVLYESPSLDGPHIASNRLASAPEARIATGVILIPSHAPGYLGRPKNKT